MQFLNFSYQFIFGKFSAVPENYGKNFFHKFVLSSK